MWKAQRLAQTRELPMAATRPIKARVWVNLAKPTRRRAKAERIAILARIDDSNAVIRVR